MIFKDPYRIDHSLSDKPVYFQTECKWTISELTPNQLTVPFTTKMGPKTFQGKRLPLVFLCHLRHVICLTWRELTNLNESLRRKKNSRRFDDWNKLYFWQTNCRYLQTSELVFLFNKRSYSRKQLWKASQLSYSVKNFHNQMVLCQL